VEALKPQGFKEDPPKGGYDVRFPPCPREIIFEFVVEERNDESISLIEEL